MCDWQKGIGTLDPKAKVNFSFRNGFSTYCDNLQLFKALGIYNQIERDVLRGFEKARRKYWGIPNGTEDHGYYDITERPQVTVISGLITDTDDLGKTIVLQNSGKEPINQKVKITTSRTEFQETTINIGTSLEFNEGTNIEVASESSKFTSTFSMESKKQITEVYSQETETDFVISSGEQLVRIKNPTQITRFRVRVVGKFCINCDPQYNGHYLWMPYLNKEYECNVTISDVGATAWRVEKISGVMATANMSVGAA
ncbi:hypothetical protein ACTJIJ_13900 [Niabella sp. 22666]|uniref:hypothetical protein n=1 Tax=Niabella sp. 22666 TaxID=3453954 RepID=UPI003F8582DF